MESPPTYSEKKPKVEYNEKLKKGKFGSRKRVLAGLTGNLPKMVHPSRSPKDLDITKILLNVFAKGDYEALGDFSKDAMLISCMHFMDPFNFDEQHRMEESSRSVQ